MHSIHACIRACIRARIYVSISHGTLPHTHPHIPACMRASMLKSQRVTHTHAWHRTTPHDTTTRCVASSPATLHHNTPHYATLRYKYACADICIRSYTHTASHHPRIELHDITYLANKQDKHTYTQLHTYSHTCITACTCTCIHGCTHQMHTHTYAYIHACNTCIGAYMQALHT